MLLHSGRCQVIDDYDGELVVENMAPDFEEGIRSLSLVLTGVKIDHLESREYGDGRAVQWQVSSFKANNAFCAIIYLKGGTYILVSQCVILCNVADFSDNMMKLGDMCAAMRSILKSTFAVRYFYCPGIKNMSGFLANS